MPKRRYVSSVRSAAAATSRARVVAAAAALLRQDGGIAGFSLEAVARAAGVARLTVYNQFGSRRGLLEVVFDDIAARGGLTSLPGLMQMADARTALTQLIDIFCAFWGGDQAIGRLHEAVALDA